MLYSTLHKKRSKVNPVGPEQDIISSLNDIEAGMTDNFQIRNPRVTDREAWDELWLGYTQFYESSLAAEVTDGLWQRIHDPAHEIQCRLAVDEADRPIGLVHFFPHAHTWYLERVLCYGLDAKLFFKKLFRYLQFFTHYRSLSSTNSCNFYCTKATALIKLHYNCAYKFV